MISGTFKALGVIASLFVLGACETDAGRTTGETTGEPQITRVSPYVKQNDFRLVFNYRNMGQTTTSAQALERALYEFGVRNPNGVGNPNVRSLLARLDMDSNRMNGLGGIQARAYADVVDVALAGNQWGGELDKLDPVNRPNQWIEVVGQIQREVVNKDGVTEPGFHFDAGNKSGHLWVLMETTYKRGATIKRLGQMFKVEVMPMGFTVEEKTPENDPDYDPADVFPDFAREADITIGADKASDYNWKLWAVGEKIRVVEYWVDKMYDPAAPDWDKFYIGSTPRPGPRLENIFAADPMACVDMMFETDPRTFTGGMLPDPAAPPFYCLGRCKNPPIINTR